MSSTSRDTCDVYHRDSAASHSRGSEGRISAILDFVPKLILEPEEEPISVTVSSKELQPIIFPSSKADCSPVKTDIPLVFKTQQACAENEDLFEPLDCEVSVSLEAITYFLGE